MQCSLITIVFNMKKTIITLFFTCVLSAAYAQKSPLEEYIQVGLQNNLAIKQEQFKLQQAYDALTESKGLFLPSVNLQSDYTYASGGRFISIPLGDLLNPVYSSLNQLTNGQRFPQLQNQKVLFNPNNYHDTRLVTTLPLINAEIYYNHAIKKEAITQQQAEIRAYKRALVKDIKVAYYQLANAQNAIVIYQNAAQLLEQNYKTTNSLISNGKVLKGNAVRILAEINNNQANLTAATDKKKVAAAYFNFLLNKPLTDTVEIRIQNPVPSDQETEGMTDTTKLSAREELLQLKSAIRQTSLNVQLKKSAFVPSLATWVNTGYQGFDFKFNGDTRYIFGGISLKWNLFNGGQDKSRVRQAKTDLLALETRYDETEKQFRLQLIQAESELNTVRSQSHSATANVKNYEEYYRETKLRYAQGLVLIVELDDAFTQLINGRIAQQLSRANVQIKLAELEQAAATYSL